MPQHLDMLHPHPEQVPVADTVAAADPLPVPRGDEFHDSDRRTRVEAAEILIRNEPGMAAGDGIGGAGEVELVGSDGDHVILTVEGPAVVETVEPGEFRLLAVVLVLISHAVVRRLGCDWEGLRLLRVA